MARNPLRPDQFQIDVPWDYDPKLKLCNRAGKVGLWLKYYLPTGKRRFVRVSSTRRTAESAAKRKALELERGIFDRSDIDRMPEIGIRRAKRVDAVDLYYELPPAKPKKGKARKAGPKTRQAQEPSLRVLVDAFGRFAPGPVEYIDEVDGPIFQRAVEQLREERGFGEGTGNSYIVMGRKLFNRFIHHGYYTGTNPADEVVVDWVDAERDVYIPPNHLAMLVTAPISSRCTVALRALIKTMAGLGLRTGEALHLEWFDIDFDRRLVKIRAKPNTPTRFGLGWKPKWDKERDIPMPSIVADVLRELPRHVVTGKLPDGTYQPGSFVFPRKARKRELAAGATEYVRCDCVNKMFHTLLESVGLHEDGVLLERFGRPKGTYYINDLRTTFNTFGKEVAGLTDHEASNLLGNTPDVNRRHYSAFVGDEAHGKVNRLAEYLLKSAKVGGRE